MTCSGGVIASGYAASLPILTIGSGPVAGADRRRRAGARAVPASTGARAHRRHHRRHGRHDARRRRHPTRPAAGRATTRHGQYEYFVPTLDVRSVGAGGGSIVRFDATPRRCASARRARAPPGPGRYRRGGTEPTVTDADLVVGYLNPDYFLGGKHGARASTRRRARSRALGEPLGFTADETAAARCGSSTARWPTRSAWRASSRATTRAGSRHVRLRRRRAGARARRSPRAGDRASSVPLSDLAAGWSAFGVASPTRSWCGGRRPMREPFDHGLMNATWQELEQTIQRQLHQQAIADDDVTWERAVDIRYGLQISELTIPAPSGRLRRLDRRLAGRGLRAGVRAAVRPGLRLCGRRIHADEHARQRTRPDQQRRAPRRGRRRRCRWPQGDAGAARRHLVRTGHRPDADKGHRQLGAGSCRQPLTVPSSSSSWIRPSSSVTARRHASTRSAAS